MLYIEIFVLFDSFSAFVLLSIITIPPLLSHVDSDYSVHCISLLLNLFQRQLSKTLVIHILNVGCLLHGYVLFSLELIPFSTK